MAILPISQTTSLSVGFSRVIEQSPGCEESSSPLGEEELFSHFRHLQNKRTGNLPKFQWSKEYHFLAHSTVPFSIEFEYPILFWFKLLFAQIFSPIFLTHFHKALSSVSTFFSSPHFRSFLAFSVFSAKSASFSAQPVYQFDNIMGWNGVILHFGQTFERFDILFQFCQFPLCLGRLIYSAGVASCYSLLLIRPFLGWF